MRTIHAVFAGIAMALLTCACSGPEDTDVPSASQAPTPYTGYPDSIAVLGHSGATGEGSGGEPGVEVRENSWATGTNPAVNSVYLRILQANKAIEGHANNLAEGGADLAKIHEQAKAAVALDPAPQLVLVQAIDNDLACPAGDAELKRFEDQLTQVLTTLSDGLPASRFFFTVQDSSSPSKEAKTLTVAERKQFGGEGPCAIFDPEGRVVPAEIKRLEAIIARYDERLAAVCERFERCHHDPALFTYAGRREYRAPDLNHDSVAGLAHNAEAAWSALQKAGLVPAS
jgi:hypothetical protein